MKTLLNRILFLVVILCFFSVSSFGQVQVEFIKGEKELYATGDTISMKVSATVPQKTCADGMARIVFFRSGLKICNNEKWEKINPGLWEKTVTVVITGNKKDVAMLTIMRRSDIQSFTYQQRFKYQRL